jgi:lysozyme family protein
MVIGHPYSYYEDRFKRMVIHPNRELSVSSVAHRILDGKQRYQLIQAATANSGALAAGATPPASGALAERGGTSGVPWWFIGILHYREGDCNFDTYLGNGQSLHERTTITPKNRGPFNSFAAGAMDALRIQGFLNLKSWTVGEVGSRAEAFNGEGYYYHGMVDPYVFGGSDQYVRGKYRSDNNLDTKLVDPQLGILVILKRLAELDSSIALTYYSESPQAKVKSVVVIASAETAPPNSGGLAAGGLPYNGAPAVIDTTPPNPQAVAQAATSGVNVSKQSAVSTLSTVSLTSIFAAIVPLLAFLDPNSTITHYIVAGLLGVGALGAGAISAWNYLNHNSQASSNTVSEITQLTAMVQQLAAQLQAVDKQRAAAGAANGTVPPVAVAPAETFAPSTVVNPQSIPLNPKATP